MDSCSVIASFGFKGTVSGVTGSPSLGVDLTKTHRCDFTGTGKMVYDAMRDGATLTIAAGATQTFDLTGGLTSPLNESIAGALAFAQVYALYVVHDSASLASSIRAFDQTAGNDFLGMLNAGAKITMTPGRGVGFIVQADQTGMTVDATHRKIDIINLDGANAATVRVYIQGKVP